MGISKLKSQILQECIIRWLQQYPSSVNDLEILNGLFSLPSKSIGSAACISFFSRPLETVPCAPTTIAITVTFMFHKNAEWCF